MLSENLPIYNIVFELSKTSFSYAKNFERPSRIMVGERMVSDSLEMLSCVLNANSNLAGERVRHLNKYRVLLEEMKTLARFALESKILSNEQASKLAIHLTSVGRQLSGWRNSTIEKMKNSGLSEELTALNADIADTAEMVNGLQQFEGDILNGKYK